MSATNPVHHGRPANPNPHSVHQQHIALCAELAIRCLWHHQFSSIGEDNHFWLPDKTHVFELGKSQPPVSVHELVVRECTTANPLSPGSQSLVFLDLQTRNEPSEEICDPGISSEGSYCLFTVVLDHKLGPNKAVEVTIQEALPSWYHRYDASDSRHLGLVMLHRRFPFCRLFCSCDGVIVYPLTLLLDRFAKSDGRGQCYWGAA